MSSRRISTSLILFSTLWASSTAFAPPCLSTNTKYVVERLPPLPPPHCMSTEKISYTNNTQRRRGQRLIILSATKSDEDTEKTVSAMKAKEIRQELGECIDIVYVNGIRLQYDIALSHIIPQT